MLVRTLVLATLALNTASAETVTKPACSDPTLTTSKPRSVRDVDWCNFDGFALWNGGLRRGYSSVHLYADVGGPHDTISYQLTDLVYADFDNDKVLDVGAVIKEHTWIGATGASHAGGSTMHVYTIVRGATVHLGNIPTGTPVHAVTTRKGIVEITSGPDRTITKLRYRKRAQQFEASK